MKNKCPGSEIQITEKNCPNCGALVELFTGEYRVKCPKCRCFVYRDKASCAEWCPMADKCFGHKSEARNPKSETISKSKIQNPKH